MWVQHLAVRKDMRLTGDGLVVQHNTDCNHGDKAQQHSASHGVQLVVWQGVTQCNVCNDEPGKHCPQAPSNLAEHKEHLHIEVAR